MKLDLFKKKDKEVKQTSLKLLLMLRKLNKQ